MEDNYDNEVAKIKSISFLSDFLRSYEGRYGKDEIVHNITYKCGEILGIYAEEVDDSVFWKSLKELHLNINALLAKFLPEFNSITKQ